jgi:serine/threonine protein kinase
MNGRYRVLRQLGEGGSSTVYACIDKRPDIREGDSPVVATKCYRAGLHHFALREYRIMRRMHAPSTHLFLWPLDAFRYLNHVCLLLERLGSSVIERPAAWGRMPVNQIMRDVLQVLPTLHKVGCIRGDVKSENGLVDEHHRIKLIDLANLRTPSSLHHQCTMTVTRPAPGYLLGLPWGVGVGSWGVGCGWSSSLANSSTRPSRSPRRAPWPKRFGSRISPSRSPSWNRNSPTVSPHQASA